ncbi:hypothetical protein G4B88_005809 [Cannabis sativa]|uniref:Uncharacterized protein n=1 Tax=Cannabis sativa TaxID=3483 RepID=A0A7J6G2V9_CANSA|nr:hypothetical protein G4B88_005809 [Cannabis sativa]
MPAAPIGWFLPEDVPGRKDSEGSTGSRSLSQRRRMRQSHYTLREEVCKPVQHPEKEDSRDRPGLASPYLCLPNMPENGQSENADRKDPRHSSARHTCHENGGPLRKPLFGVSPMGLIGAGSFLIELDGNWLTSGWQLLTLIHVDQHADTLPEHAGMSLTYWLIGGFPSLSIRIGAIAINDMTATIGQKPYVTHAKKSIATFKLREGALTTLNSRQESLRERVELIHHRGIAEPIFMNNLFPTDGTSRWRQERISPCNEQGECDEQKKCGLLVQGPIQKSRVPMKQRLLTEG